MSLVRGVPTMGQQAEIGLNLRINQYNSHARREDHTIRLYIDNDDYSPKLARANVKRYIDEGIKFLLMPIGTPTTLSYMDMVEDKDFGVFFPITGSMDLRKPNFRHVVHFRASYEDEVKALITALLKEYGALKFAFFYQDDAYGRGPLATAIQQLKRQGITNFLALPYTRGSVSFELQIRELEKNQPDALGFFATATATQELIRQMGVVPLANTQLFGISFVGELTLRRFAKRHGLNFLLGSSVPNPRVSSLPIAKSYRKAMDNINNNYDVFSFEAFIATSIFLKAIDSLGKKPLTPNNVISAMESMKNVNFQGLELNFNEKTRSLARKVWLESEESNHWKEFPIK
jgi:ABC-type branched-subunit amino acid transport system substrate-binding protein